ncbi:hypothetical protein QF002_002482 [Paraburkholderia youngii]
MSICKVVLVHGGHFAADCWTAVVAMTSEIRTVISNSRDAGDIVQTSTITVLRGSSAQQRVSFVAGKRENAQHFGESLGLLLHAIGCGRVLVNER